MSDLVALKCFSGFVYFTELSAY